MQSQSCASAAFDVFVAGVGLLSDAYDFTIINLVRSDLAALYPPRADDFASSWQRSLITASSIFGAMFGQVVLGCAADKLGRRRLFLLSNSLTMVGSFGSACAWDFGEHHDGIWAMLIFWRFVMGVGIGGEYPLSASHTAEHSRPGTSGFRMALVFTLFGVGPVMASALVYVCQVSGAPPAFTWRFAFAFGGLLSVASLVLRYRCVHDSPEFERVRRQRRDALLIDGEGEPPRLHHLEQAAAQAGRPQLHVVSTADGAAALAAAREPLAHVLRAYWRPLIGTMGTWLLYDVVDYGLGLYSEDVLKKLTVGNDAASATLAVLLVQLIGLPGCFFSVFTIPKLGRKQTQIFGAMGMLLVYATLALALSNQTTHDLPTRLPGVFVALYGLQLIFDYMGPGATTYVVPGEIFPTAVRATCHGLSAASGKLGAAIGSYAFGALIDGQLGLDGTFFLTAGLTAAVLAITALCTPKYDDQILLHLEAAHQQGSTMELLYAPEKYFAKLAVQTAPAHR